MIPPGPFGGRAGLDFRGASANDSPELTHSLQPDAFSRRIAVTRAAIFDRVGPRAGGLEWNQPAVRQAARLTRFITFDRLDSDARHDRKNERGNP